MAIRLAAYARRNAGPDYPRFLRQHGVVDVVGTYADHPDHARRFALVGGDPAARWEPDELLELRRACEADGLRLAGMESPTPRWCYDRVMLGLPGRDEQIEAFAATVRAMGRAGIPVLAYNWMVNPTGRERAVWRTALEAPDGRGDSLVDSFDLALATDPPLWRDRVYTEDEMWANYAYFLDAIVPVAEDAGVRLALHPPDPPVATLGGIPRLCHDPAGFRRAMALAGNSPASGLNFCLGNWTAMGTDIVAAIREFGARGQIVCAHAQGVKGVVPRFSECFLDEADCDVAAASRALDDVGFDGTLLPGHFPLTAGESFPQYFHGHAYAFGYLHAILRAINAGPRAG